MLQIDLEHLNSEIQIGLSVSDLNKAYLKTDVTSVIFQFSFVLNIVT